MPAKNSIKDFVEDGIYHVYNRGVDKREIFMDDHDYQHFLWIIDEYLKPDHPNPNNPLYMRYGLGDELSILCYCLMPNHFHFLIKQKTKDALTKFMRRVITNYVTYFNNKYERSGTLFQGTYKAAPINTDPYLMQISSYIHRNPIKLSPDLSKYKYSSYNDYLGSNKHGWLNTDEILNLFTVKNSLNKPETQYKEFVNFSEQYNDEAFRSMALDIE